MKKVLVFLMVCFAGIALHAQDLHWTMDEGNGASAMNTSMTGVLYIDHVMHSSPSQLEVGVFDQDGICRGAKLPKWNNSKQKWFYQLVIKGNEGFTYTFKIYDHANNQELDYVDDFGEVITWGSGKKYGSTSSPYEMNFTASGTSYTKDITGVGEANWNQYNNGGYYLIASPLAGTTSPTAVGGMIDDNGYYDLYSFDQTDPYNEWQNYKVHNFTLQNDGDYCRGYLYANMNDVTLTFTGTPVDYESKEFDLEYSYTTSSKLQGWNLIGNPFTVEAYVNRNFYVIKEDGRNEIVLATSNTIPPMEGAFVYADSEGEKVVVSKTPFNAKMARLNLNVSKDRGVIDCAAVNFGEGSLPKLQLNPNHTKIYIPQDGKDYAVVSSEGMGELPVNFKAEKSGTYTLSFNAEDVSFNYLHLIDNLTKNDVDLLANPSYTFDASITDNARRFTLVFATGNDNDENFAFFSNGQWIINNDGEATLQVVDALGRVLSSETVSGNCSKAINAAAGVYMLRLINGNDVKVQKVIVK